jgi:hypothetical protein
MSKIQVNEIVNHFDNGAPDCPRGLTITGVATATTLDVTGNVSVGGTLTYDDVTNIDSVGIITAQAGVNVTGGDVVVGGAATISSTGAITNAGGITAAGPISVPSPYVFNVDSNQIAITDSNVTVKHTQGSTAEAYRVTRFNGSSAVTTASINADGSAYFASEVGIGVNPPSRGPLHINSSTADAYFHVTNSTTGSTASDGFTLHQSGTETLLNNREAGSMRFYTGGTEMMRIDSSGRVLIGLNASVDSNSSLQVEGRDTITAIRYSAATGNAGSKLELSRSASNTAGVTAAVSPTDELGEIRWRGASTGSNFNTGASINAVVASGTISASSFPTDLLFKTTSDGSGSAVERMRITSAGRIGINDNNPDSILHATDTSAAVIKVQNNTNTSYSGFECDQSNDNTHFGIYAFDSSSASTPNAVELWNYRAGDIRIATSSVLRAHWLSGGALQTVANSNVDVIYSSAAASGTSAAVFRGLHSATVGTPGSGTDSIYIYANGNIQNTNNSYGQISDIKLKENIVDAGSQWSDFKSVKFRKYNFKEETGHETYTQLGVVAQELELTSPGLVYETNDRDSDGNDLGTTTKGVKSSVLTMKALVALQEAMTRIETLEAEVAALKGS